MFPPEHLCKTPIFGISPLEGKESTQADEILNLGTCRLNPHYQHHQLPPYPHYQHQIREAILHQIGCFFTHCVNGPWPPPPRFTQSCCGFFDINVKKCVNVCRDKIWHNSAKICGQNVKFTLKLWQFYPWKYFFVSILCCQKAFRMIQICNINLHNV